MKLLFAALLLTSGVAQAHLQIGTYEGKTADGSVCQVEIEKVYFENNMHHPLNERAVAKVGTETFTIQHPPVINVEQMTAAYNHDLFQGVLPTDIGAHALVINMDHSQQKEGPSAFHVISHEYRADNRALYSCSSLVFKN